MARLVPFLILLLAGLSPGCLVVPFGYPTWSRTPELKVNGAGEEVLAVVVKTKVSKSWNSCLPGYTPERSETRQVKCVHLLCSATELPSENRLAVNYGWGCFVLPYPLWTWCSVHHDLEILLYKARHKLVTKPAWSSDAAVLWEPAVSLEEQLEALARVSVSPHSPDGDWTIHDPCYLVYMESEWRRLESEIPPGHPLRLRFDELRVQSK